MLHENKKSTKTNINPVKAINKPRINGIKGMITLVIERSVPIIKQKIVRTVLNIFSALSIFEFIFTQKITIINLHIKN